MRIKDNYYRLYLPDPLAENKIFNIDGDTTHYLSIVLKLKNKQIVKVFNDKSGEFIAEFINDKKNPHLIVRQSLRHATKAKTLYLGMCIVKNAIMSEIFDKGTQLGVTHFLPIISSYTQNKEFNLGRYQKIIKEATEQCGRCDMPILEEPQSLEHFLQRQFDLLIFANETEEEKNVLNIEKWPKNIALLVGPEGGFSSDEIEMIQKTRNTFSITLSKNILRSETAVIALLSQIQLLREAHTLQDGELMPQSAPRL
jgi:16S rRNA (uracil1498-N3)-methyltransferase